MLILYLLTFLLGCLSAVYLYDYDDQIPRTRSSIPTEILEFEPINPLPTNTEPEAKETDFMKNIMCDDFTSYALNCTTEAAMMYNSSRKAPPMPAKIGDWCRAIRHLTNCAIDWNTDCKDMTESYFNDESINGHKHVLESICDDDWFLAKYDNVPSCIDGVSELWEQCYLTFKHIIDDEKNTTHEWTHFEIHFNMCCARARFRRCTLNALFDVPAACPYEQMVTLQLFSVIVSQGDVFQDCDRNVMYENCPEGDPRPTGRSLAKLMNADTPNSARLNQCLFFIYFLCIFVIVLLY